MTRTSTRTAPVRCWPTRPTATWPGSPPSGPRCCCATRAGCCPSTPSAIGSIAVIGPLADSARDIIGPWVFDFDLDETVTVLEGIRARAGDAIRVEHARGVPVVQREFPSLFDMFGGNTPEDPDGFDEDAEFQRAVDLARGADVAVVVVGEWQNMIGEMASRSSLELPGRQLELLQAVVATGTPVVLLVMNGRPLDLRWAAANVPAILDIWYPGTQGGAAVANLLFGDVSPGGKLPFTWPRTVGQVPMIYSHTRSHEPENQARRYWDEASTPLFPFGHGLSYGRFAYRNLTVDQPSTTHGRDRHGLGRGHQHRGPRGRRGRPALPAPALRHRLTAGPRAQGLPAGHPGRRASRGRSVPGRAGRTAVLERGRPRLGPRRLDLRRLGRWRLHRRAGHQLRDHEMTIGHHRRSRAVPGPAARVPLAASMLSLRSGRGAGRRVGAASARRRALGVPSTSPFRSRDSLRRPVAACQQSAFTAPRTCAGTASPMSAALAGKRLLLEKPVGFTVAVPQAVGGCRRRRRCRDPDDADLPLHRAGARLPEFDGRFSAPLPPHRDAPGSALAGSPFATPWRQAARAVRFDLWRTP